MKLHRRLARCSRADVLWSLALFAVAQVGLAVAIEYWLPGLRDPRFASRAEQLVRRTATAGTRPLSIVMLGSSHVQDGFNSTELEAKLSEEFHRPLVVFNFGVPAAGPVASVLHFERLIAAGAKPDLALVEVTPTMLNGVAGRPVESGYFCADRLWYGEIDLVGRYGMPVDELRHDWLQNWPIPCHSHRSAIASRLMPHMLPFWLRLDGDREVDRSGWKPRNVKVLTAEDRRRSTEYAQRDFGEPLQRFELCEGACRAQHDLLRRCREEQVAAVLVWMPEGKTFQGYYPAAAEQQIRHHLDELCAEFDVPLIDARDWVDDEGFVDGHHLRLVGAIEFSRRLGNEVLEPILNTPRPDWDGYLASLLRRGEQRTSVANRVIPSPDASLRR
ncbi:MAG TPA: DUF1574 family protein [Pirellulales bacterium]|nr:DUF1574 family protein [Pirellulales bacterium]